MRRAALVVLLAIAPCILSCASSGARHARSLYERGDYAGAASAADAELAKSPGDADAWRVRLRATLAQGDARGAVAAYRRWRGERGDDREALRQMAFDTLELGLRSPSQAVQV